MAGFTGPVPQPLFIRCSIVVWNYIRRPPCCQYNGNTFFDAAVESFCRAAMFSCFPAGGLLFFCVRRKEAKEDRICFAASMQKRDCRLPAVPFCTNHPSPYALFGWVREGAFPGEKPSPANTATACARRNPCRGPSFLLCQKKRSKRRPHLFCSQHAKKRLPLTGSPFLCITPYPICAFRVGPGGGFSRGKASSRMYLISKPASHHPPKLPSSDPKRS